MPLVRIAVTAGHPAPRRRAIADAVHQALVETMNVPPDDRFQIVTEHGPEALIYDRNYAGIPRSDDFVGIQIALRRGRTVAMKRALYRRIAERLQDAAQVRPQDVFVSLIENDNADWSFGNGEAPYAKE
jgi:4-oxalocrotonate tautomerase